jgi:hypothetical protein
MTIFRCALAAAIVLGFTVATAAPPLTPTSRPHIARQPLENPRAVVPIQAILIGDEDCIAFDPAAVISQGGLVRAGGTLLLNYGPDKTSAAHAANVIRSTAFDTQCFVTRRPGAMMYWKTANHIPSALQPGEDCAAVNPASTFVRNYGNGWVVISGIAPLANYGSDRAGADRAVQLIKAYKLTRQCAIKRPNAVMTYWLAE